MRRRDAFGRGKSALSVWKKRHEWPDHLVGPAARGEPSDMAKLASKATIQRLVRSATTTGLPIGAVAGLAATLMSSCTNYPAPRLQEGPFSDRFAGRSPIRTASAAVDRVLQVHPDLRSFTSRALPPASIETRPAPDDGWQVGFLHLGSGRPGVIDARCFLVDSGGRVSSVGENSSAGRLAPCWTTP